MKCTDCGKELTKSEIEAWEANQKYLGWKLQLCNDCFGKRMTGKDKK